MIHSMEKIFVDPLSCYVGVRQVVRLSDEIMSLLLCSFKEIHRTGNLLEQNGEYRLENDVTLRPLKN